MGPVRLDSDILLQALAQAGETDPYNAADANLSNRDLDDVSLLEVETPQLQNLNLAFNHLRRVNPIHKLECLTKLNLSHNQLLDVERLGSLRDLEVLNLSKNRLASVGSIAQLQNLEELWLRDNQFSELHALQSLGQCSALKRLILKPNPVCKKCPELYWPFLVHNIASLELLDGRPVGADERDAAAAFLLSPEGRKQLRESGLNSRCNARAVPAVYADPDASSWAHEARDRRPAPPKKIKSAAGERKPREGRSERVPLSTRTKPVPSGGDEGDGGVAPPPRARGVDDGHTQLYSNGQIAVVARRDGASEARYFNGSIAVSLGDGRVTAMYRNGDVAVTSDDSGNAMVCLPSGLVVYNHSQGSGGRLNDLVTGQQLQEWDSNGRSKGESAKNPAAASDVVKGGVGGSKALLQCRLNEHIGVRVDSTGGKVEVFFVCDASGAKGGGGGLPGSTKKEEKRRIKHRFSAVRPGGRADWDDSGPFGDGAAPPRERGPVIKPITTDEYVHEIRAATDQIIDFEAFKSKLGSGGDDIDLVFRGKINASGTTGSMLAATSKSSKPGAASRRAAYDKTMRGKGENTMQLAISDSMATSPGARLSYADPPTHSHSPGLYSQLQSYGTPTGSPSKESSSKRSPLRGSHGKSPRGGGLMLADDPTELMQQLARNAQDALKNLAANLAADIKIEATYSSPNWSPPKKNKPPRAPAAANARARDVSHDNTSTSRARRASKDSGPDKYLSPGGGYNGSTAGGSGPKERRVVGGRKGGGEKLSTGEDVTPDLPAEEMQRLEAIRAQMRNMTLALSSGY